MGNGKMIKLKEKVFIFGMTEGNMMELGKMIKQKEKELYIIQLEINFKGFELMGNNKEIFTIIIK